MAPPDIVDADLAVLLPHDRLLVTEVRIEITEGLHPMLEVGRIALLGETAIVGFEQIAGPGHTVGQLRPAVVLWFIDEPVHGPWSTHIACRTCLKRVLDGPVFIPQQLIGGPDMPPIPRFFEGCCANPPEENRFIQLQRLAVIVGIDGSGNFRQFGNGKIQTSEQPLAMVALQAGSGKRIFKTELLEGPGRRLPDRISRDPRFKVMGARVTERGGFLGQWNQDGNQAALRRSIEEGGEISHGPRRAVFHLRICLTEVADKRGHDTVETGNGEGRGPVLPVGDDPVDGACGPLADNPLVLDHKVAQNRQGGAPFPAQTREDFDNFQTDEQIGRSGKLFGQRGDDCSPSFDQRFGRRVDPADVITG